MSLDGILLTDVTRTVREQHATGLFCLVTGAKGTGKSFTLRAFSRGVASGTSSGACVSSLVGQLTVAGRRDVEEGCGDEGGSDGPPLRVCTLDYNLLAREGEGLASFARSYSVTEPVFAPGTVVVMDDLDALWLLCSLNGKLQTLKLLIKRLLASPASALVASAREEGSVPTEVLEWRRPITYPLSTLTPATARRTIRARFGASEENDLVSTENCVTEVPTGTTRGKLVLALCLVRAAGEAAEDEDGAGQAPVVFSTEEYLSWLDRGGRREEPDSGAAAATAPLYGLDEVRARLHTLVSVFAAARPASGCDGGSVPLVAGGVAASLQGTTGVLLHGPSGCGKTALARQLAGCFPQVSFVYVKCTSLFSKFLGESEERLRQVYRRARAQAPAVVVLDDVDVIAQSRGSMGNTEGSSGSGSSGGSVNVSRRMLAGLLCELDGVTDNSGVLTIGTTNAPEVLDSALLRQGRLETLLLVPPLTQSAAMQMCCRTFAVFAGGDEEKQERARQVSRAAVGSSAVSLGMVLRRVLEASLVNLPTPDGDVDEGFCAASDARLPLPSAMDVNTILLESSPMLLPSSYTLDDV